MRDLVSSRRTFIENVDWKLRILGVWAGEGDSTGVRGAGAGYGKPLRINFFKEYQLGWGLCLWQVLFWSLIFCFGKIWNIYTSNSIFIDLTAWLVNYNQLFFLEFFVLVNWGQIVVCFSMNCFISPNTVYHIPECCVIGQVVVVHGLVCRWDLSPVVQAPFWVIYVC